MLLARSFFSQLSVTGRLVAPLVALLACSAAFAQKPEQMLGRLPSQPDVEIDVPADEDVAKCTVKQFKELGYTGVALYAPDGVTVLRTWVASPPKAGQKASVEQIRFYKDGVEVFRDVLGKEARWLNTAGSRRGLLGADKKTIASWTTISPQEATQEAVAALKTNDFARYQRVALSSEDLATLGLSGPLATEIQKQVKGVTEAAFTTLASTLDIPSDANWGALNTSLPATIPAGESIENDLEAYYNVAIIVMKSGDAAQSQELYVGDLVKVGNAWKIIGLPAGEPFGHATGSVSASSILIPSEGGNAAVAGSADAGELGTALSDAYHKLETADPRTYPALCDQTVELLVNIAANSPAESDNMLSQAVDIIFNGVQTGMYPAGVNKLSELQEKLGEAASDEVKARIRQRLITAEFYSVSQSQPQPKPSELQKAQEKYTESLAAFVEEYANTAAGSEAAMSLALDQEYLMENDSAIKYYQQVAQNAEGTIIGRRAQGALTRVQSEGETLVAPRLKFTDGSDCVFTSASKPTVIFFWGSWDLDSVNQAQELAASVNLVGINIDSAPDPTPAAAAAYFQQITRGLPWKNVCDPAGLDGEAAVAFGVQTAPWAIIVDTAGKVVRSNIANMEELADVVKELK